MIADPVRWSTALAALAHRHLVVHFDVDVLDARVAASRHRDDGTGMRLDHVAPLLRTLVADPRVVGMTLVEANPDHDPDGASTPQLVTAVGAALAAWTSAVD